MAARSRKAVVRIRMKRGEVPLRGRLLFEVRHRGSVAVLARSRSFASLRMTISSMDEQVLGGWHSASRALPLGDGVGAEDGE